MRNRERGEDFAAIQIFILTTTLLPKGKERSNYTRL